MKIRILALILAVVLICCSGCGQQAASTASSAAYTEASSSVSPTASSKPEPAEADRYEQVIQVPEGKFNIYFFDLDFVKGDSDKSGDCTLLISPDGKTMLIDAGNKGCGSQVLNHLKALNIEKIDYLVVSHPHVDHIGSIVRVAENFEIGTHLRTELEYTTGTYVDYNAHFKKHDIPTTYMHEGDEFDFGEFIHVTVLNPTEQIEYPDNYPENSTQFVNNSSLTMRFDYGKSSYLTCGDLYITGERDVIEKYAELLDVDVAKANHHGIDTSNSNKWIKAVSPKYVIAMNDDIGSMTVYDNYCKKGSEYYNTAFDGTVRVSMDDNGNYELISQHDSWLRK